MYAGNIETYFDTTTHECPICGFREELDGVSVMVGFVKRGPSRQEIMAYQSLYGDLVKEVPHYQN